MLVVLPVDHKLQDVEVYQIKKEYLENLSKVPDKLIKVEEGELSQSRIIKKLSFEVEDDQGDAEGGSKQENSDDIVENCF